MANFFKQTTDGMVAYYAENKGIELVIISQFNTAFIEKKGFFEKTYGTRRTEQVSEIEFKEKAGDLIAKFVNFLEFLNKEE